MRSNTIPVRRAQYENRRRYQLGRSSGMRWLTTPGGSAPRGGTRMASRGPGPAEPGSEGVDVIPHVRQIVSGLVVAVRDAVDGAAQDTVLAPVALPVLLEHVVHGVFPAD